MHSAKQNIDLLSKSIISQSDMAQTQNGLEMYSRNDFINSAYKSGIVFNLNIKNRGIIYG